MRRGAHHAPLRPMSWCLGGFRESHPVGIREPQPPCLPEEGAARPPNQPGQLVRSTSYHALHSALARLYRLDDFTMERIGQGFFSEVYRVRHRVTGEVMVLKMNKLISNRHNMLREVELMNRLHHPNILSYFGVCIHEGQVHALTEYINGGSLYDLIQNSRIELSWTARVSLALDIARGMAYLHSMDVFHRDLTDKNVLIKHTEEGGRRKLRAVIADFGLAARIPKDRCVRLRQVGSPYWMAPEVIRGDWYDHRVDVFSFGIIVCEMIARCEADPDVLPRTHNFGVHYLAFSRMCQNDCPPSFLEMAFQCCQIDPDSRPGFSELMMNLETLLAYLTADQRPAAAHHKVKVYHRRSLSDDSCGHARNQADSLPSNGAGVAGTPQEVLERLSAADPYFQPSSDTVNPFNEIKLPAKTQLILQEGGRCCHSLPDIGSLTFCQPSTPLVSSVHLAISETSLCRTSPTPNPCPCLRVVCNTTVSSELCQCSLSSQRTLSERDEIECKCELNIVSKYEVMSDLEAHCKGRLLPHLWGREPLRTYIPSEDDEGASSNSPRSDGIAGGTTLSSHHLGAVRRRGSGESGFFSVEDVERIGTPELCLSYSELSTASLVSTEDEEPGHGTVVHRSSSVVTDSSEDLSSVGCHDHNSDQASLPDPDDSLHVNVDADYSTDIKAIVEFFERGYGSMRTSSEGAKRLVPRPLPRKVPLLRNKFISTTYRQYSTYTSPICCKQSHLGSNAHLNSKSVFAKENPIPKPTYRPPSYCRRDNFRVKERPKVYITEGTVRAKRNIFESK